ncbi:MAG TPA: four-carbon acid sugar kinase family protein [Opitutaceae bacterium]|nr:four-carbon acid sugar kinase family protein [Opitutaceae bacterium]
MPRAPDIVLADDLTGAAEIAGVAHRHGLRATLVTRATPPVGRGMTVMDTDTRLLAPAAAARRVRRLGRQAGTRLAFKKTDSVLRGPVRAELEALASPFDRILLIPANPRLGRTIRDGAYRVEGRLLHRTAFARDPHHPARTARVRDLLGAGRIALHLVAAGAALPARGLSVGEAARAADVVRWARAVDRRTLPAGGAEFFAAVLRARGARSRTPHPPVVPAGPALVVSGSLAPGALAAARAAEAEGWTVSDRRRDLTPALRTTGRAWCATALAPKDDATVVRRRVAGLVRALRATHAFSHLVIEGGATAAAVIRALRWDRLDVLGEWAPGVVALRPRSARRVVITLKPGSYAWPASLRAALRRAGPFA